MQVRIGFILACCGAAAALAGCGNAVCDDGQSRECASVCGKGEELCVAGQWRACSAPKPERDVCDGVDNNCDGVVDEECDCVTGKSRACTTACGSGTEVCVSGTWMNCNAPAPQQEVCDGVDNNCNGQKDEVCSCVHGTTEPCFEGPAAHRGVGICKEGAHTCDAGRWGDCTNQVLAAAQEDCNNNTDDDCDGIVNDGCVCNPGAKQGCGTDEGECKAGEQLCVDNAWGQCLGEIKPAREADSGCDGKDNDCNGVTDDQLPGDEAEPNNACAQATLVTLKDSDTADKVLTYNVYPAGDVDYIKVTAVEDASDICCPGWPICSNPDPECNFLAITIEQPTGVNARWEVSVLEGECANPAATHKTMDTLTFVWDGECGSDDDLDVWLKVAKKQGATTLNQSCKPYKLSLRYTSVSKQTCPAP